METINSNSKIYWYLIFLLSLFIIVLFTRDQISNFQFNREEIKANSTIEQEKRDEIQRLNDIKQKLLSSDEDISKYLIDFNEDDIIDYIYWRVEFDNSKNSDWLTVVRSISISEPVLNEMWFRESNISLNLRFPSEDRMLSMLDFLTSSDSKYKFFITSFSYNGNISDWGFNITIPLKVFYK